MTPDQTPEPLREIPPNDHHDLDLAARLGYENAREFETPTPWLALRCHCKDCIATYQANYATGEQDEKADRDLERAKLLLDIEQEEA